MDTNTPNNMVSPNINPNTNPTTGSSSEQKPACSKKKGIIIGAIIASIILVIIIVVAVILARQPEKANAFEKAQEKLLSLSEARNTKLSGSIKLATSNQDYSISEIDVRIESQIAGTPTIATVKAVPEFKLVSGQTISPELEFIITSSSEVYVKPSGLSQSLGKIAGLSYDSLPKELPFIQLIDNIDNQWLEISEEDLNELTDSISQKSGSELLCASNLVQDLGQYEYRMAEIYKAHPFIEASQDNIAIESKGNPLYRININVTDLRKYIQDSKDLEPIANFINCMGIKDISSLDTNTDEIVTIFPEFYVEIDDNYDITRVYADLSNDEIKATIDFDISYPDVVNIVEPTEYKDFGGIFEKFMTDSWATIIQD